MRFNRPANFSLVLLLSLMNAGCDRYATDTTDKNKPVDARETSLTNPEPKPAQGEADELATLAGTTVNVNSEMYSQCAGILVAAVDKTNKIMSNSQKEAVEYGVLQEDDSKLAKDLFQYMQAASAKDKSEEHDFEGSGVINSVPVLLKYSDKTSMKKESIRTETDALKFVSEAKHLMRQNLNKDSASEANFTLLTMVGNTEAIRAWRECVTRKSHGLFCASRRQGDSIVMDIQWAPNALQAKFLPVLDMAISGVDGVKLVDEKVPGTLGTGTGVSLVFSQEDPIKGGAINVSLTDKSKRVNFSCANLVPPRLRKVTKQVLVSTEYKTKPCTKQSSYQCMKPVVRPSASCRDSILGDVKTLKSEGPTMENGICKDDAPAPKACPAGYKSVGVSVARKVNCFDLKGGLKSFSERVKERRRTCERPEKLASCVVGNEPGLCFRDYQDECTDYNQPINTYATQTEFVEY